MADEFAKEEQPESVKVAAQGLHTASQFAEFMSALMCDLVSGKVPPAVGNAACVAGARMLQVVKMQQEYGQKMLDGRRKLTFTEPPETK